MSKSELSKSKLSKSEKIDIINSYRVIIDAIRRYRTNDKPLLSSYTGMSWPTIHKQLSNIISNKVLFEQTGDIYYPNKKFGYFVGLHIGKIETKIAICDFTLTPVSASSFISKSFISYLNNDGYSSASPDYLCYNTPDDIYKLSAFLNVVLKALLFMDNDIPDFDLLSIGISFPGIINFDTLRLEFSPNIRCLKGASIMDLFSTSTMNEIKSRGILLSIEHDTQASAIYEKETLFDPNNPYHSLANKPNIACVYMGAGVGLGLIINNTLLRGASNSVGEIGHARAPRLSLSNSLNSCTCDCGRNNCLESCMRHDVFNSDSFEDYLKKTDPDNLEEYINSHSEAYDILKEYIGYILNIVINVLNVDVVIFSGRVLNGIKKLKEEFNIIKSANTVSNAASVCTIISGGQRHDSVAIGTAISAYIRCSNEGKIVPVEWKNTTATLI